MALTAWEGLKVAGHVLTKLGEKGEQYEDEHGESFKPDQAFITELVIETLQELGQEIMD